VEPSSPVDVHARRPARTDARTPVLDIRSPQLVLDPATLPDLAPTILRQRLVIEGLVEHVIDADEISRYLVDLSEVLDMRALMEPAMHRSDLYGWAGWIHWETSGAHFYAWEQPVRFFSVDIYTCKAFDPLKALDFTAERFGSTTCVAKSF
jgi:S-adenosylmethionine decarboxylase